MTMNVFSLFLVLREPKLMQIQLFSFMAFTADRRNSACPSWLLTIALVRFVFVFAFVFFFFFALEQ